MRTPVFERDAMKILAKMKTISQQDNELFRVSEQYVTVTHLLAVIEGFLNSVPNKNYPENNPIFMGRKLVAEQMCKFLNDEFSPAVFKYEDHRITIHPPPSREEILAKQEKDILAAWLLAQEMENEDH
jgi:hypothetical protein